jgi:4-hydroxybenzoate polyprenyltransferase
MDGLSNIIEPLQDIFKDAIIQKIPANEKTRKIAWYVVIISAVVLFVAALFISKKSGSKSADPVDTEIERAE